MKWVSVVLIISFMGCALFRKTSKQTATSEKEALKQTYLDKVDFKSANKETHTYTWWNDSSMYQYQNIREHQDEAKLERSGSKEKELEKTKSSKKETAPVKLWIYVGLALLIVGLVVLYKRLFNKLLH